MSSNFIRVALAFTASAVLSACGSQASEPPRCTAGASATCACPDGRSGAQVCSASGTFGPCVCESAGAAPSPSPTPVAAPAVAPMQPAGAAGAPAQPTAARPTACGTVTGTQPSAPVAHVRAAMRVAAPTLAAACAEHERPVQASTLSAAFEACANAGPMSGFEACAPGGECCRFGVASLVGPPGDGEGSWVVFRGPRHVDDYEDHVYWLPPDGARVESICRWAPYLAGCYEDDISVVEDCMTPRAWVESGPQVQRFLCQPPL